MRLGKLAVGLALTGAIGWASGGGPVFAQAEQFIPRLVYRTGPYAPDGIPFANGYADYTDMINARDGGINGVRITYEECETGYNNDRGVECYERLKNHPPTGASLVDPLSTGITYALISRATADKIPVISMGYGRADASYGPVFPYVFTFPATYWAGADAIIEYIGTQVGGMDKLKGQKIALVYLNAAYGKEPIPTLKTLAAKYGFTFTGYAVNSPGLDQEATWLQIHQAQPNWVLMWGWGVMNSTAIKDAASVGYPMDHFIGIWWSGDNPDVQPAGMAAKGYKAAEFHGVGADYPAIQDILKYVYDKGHGHGPRSGVGGPLYDRGVINAMYDFEAIRTAQGKYGDKSLTGEQIRWGLENLDLTDARIKALGAEGLITPIHLSCEDHEGNGNVRMSQWDGKSWHMITGWIVPDRSFLWPMYKASAMQYAHENNITPVNCAEAHASK